MKQQTKKILLSLLAFSTIVSAKTYEACGVNKEQALELLTSSIATQVNNNFSSKTQVANTNGEEQVHQDLESYFKTSSNLTLHNIHYSKKAKEVCAAIESQEQKEYTKKLLAKALLYQSAILPNDINQKAKKLEEWLNDIHSLQQLIPVFLENDKKMQQNLAILAQKEKEFQDLYDAAILKASKLIFKSCKKEKEDALDALSSSIFKIKKEKKSFLDSITSVFSSEEKDKQTRALDLFSDKIKFTTEDKKVCAIIKKDEISQVAKRIYNDLVMFDTKMLSKDPIKRYKEIEKLLKKIEVAELLMQPFPKLFSKADFAKLAAIKQQLETIKTTTYPQYVAFHIINANNIVIKIDDKIMQKNEKIYLKEGEHTYEVKAKDRCSVKGSFSLEKFDTKSIDIDFDEYHYPTVLFITDKEPHIAINGIVVKPNIKKEIPTCEGEVFYIAKFAGQTKKDALTLAPNKTYQFDLEFLTAQEQAIFNDAKTKHFTTKNDEKLSESLTPKISKQLLFSLDESPKHGSVDLSEKGTFVYTPDEGYVGKDTFTYYIEANGEKSPIKVVNIIIEASLMKQAQQTMQQKTQDLNQTAQAIKKETDDLNQTLQQAKKEASEAVESVKKEVKKVAKEFDEAKYEKFKAYIQSLNPQTDGEKIKKLAKKYPQYFNKFLEDMAH